MRPISNAVDITNYVMLATRQPDARATTRRRCAEGRIVVRRARPGEQLVTLDGTERELDPEDLVIADAERPIGIAGVMGGENTEVSDATTTVLLEAANFDPLTVLRSGERHQMRSESADALGEGRRPESGCARRDATRRNCSPSSAGARWIGGGEARGRCRQRRR